MTQRRITQKDVAREADVSQGIVSLVLNEVEVEVAEATRQRIWEAARRLGYAPRPRGAKARPARAKAAPANNRTGKVIAYVRPVVVRNGPQDASIFEAYDEFYNQVQNQLVEQAHRKGYTLLVRPCESKAELTRWLLEWGVDGVLMHGNQPALGEWIAKRYPMVEINRRIVSGASAVMANQEEIIHLAMEYLHQRGHRRIAYASSALDTEVIVRRARAYRDTARSMGLPVYEEFLSCDTPEAIGAHLFADRPDRPTALIAGDPSALMVQKDALARGYTLPDDLSLIGIDNISADVFAAPPLTSIDVRADEVSRMALNLLGNHFDDPSLSSHKVEITPRLVERCSVATLAPSGAVQTRSL